MPVATVMRQDRLALDRSPSARSIDEDGHMHVRDVPISKANVCGYLGQEIPDAERLGLLPNRVYQLYRDPNELAKAADTFNGKPLLNLHKQQAASDHDHDLTVGAVHNVHFDAPYLRAGDFHVWDGDSIAGIDSNEQRELSSSYRYEADMTPGEVNGVRYDGVMRNIRCNHVALVPKGRAGADVVVNDAAIKFFNQEITMAKSATVSRQALLASGALRAYLHPKLASDAKLDLSSVLKGVTGKTWKADKPRIKTALDAAVKGKLAADADIEDVVDMLDQLEDVVDEMPDTAVVTASDPAEDDKGDDAAKMKAAGLTDDEIAAIMAMRDKKDPDPAPDTVTKSAMDSAIRVAADTASRNAEAATIARLRAITAAEREVRPYIGEIAVAQDSAAAVYKLALDSMSVDLTGVPEAGYGALLKAMPKPNDAPARAAPVAMDAVTVTERAKRFPNASRLSAN